MRLCRWQETRSLTALLAVLAGTVSGAVIPATPALRPVVLELYTSQGCSSCPPAEALLNELAAREGVLALAYHVDYWDDLGWHDHYSLASATERQRHWAELHTTQNIFTPQLIVDGRRSLLGSDASALSVELPAAQARALQHTAPLFSATIVDGELRIDSAASTANDCCDVVGVSYLPQATTRIERGENAGRTIRQANIVRSVTRLGAIGGSSAHLRMAVSAFPTDARKMAVLLQDTASAAIVGAQVLELR